MPLVDIFARDQLAFVRTKENRPIITPVGPDTVLRYCYRHTPDSLQIRTLPRYFDENAKQKLVNISSIALVE